MNQFILSLFFYVLSFTATAAIQIHIDPASVAQDEEFKLSLIQNDTQNVGVPDLTVLQKDFIILGTERNVSYSVINGQTQAASQWSVFLKAKKSGILTIPAIKIGLEQSTPMTIHVAGTAQAVKNQKEEQAASQVTEDVFLTTEVSTKKPYINQQVIYKVRLYVSKPLLHASYQAPQVDDALMIPLGGEKRSQVQKNNTHYVVEEQNYAIFPQKSGKLNIQSPVLNAVIYDLDAQNIQIKNKNLTLSVQPSSPQFKGKKWLPAKQIKLSEQYDNSDQQHAQGSTITRKIVIEGRGLPAQLLPSLHFANTDAFHVYPEKGSESNEVRQGELISRTEIKVTYLFNQAGKLTLPEIRLPWFNTDTGKEEWAVLAPRSFEITPAVSGTKPEGQVLPRNQPLSDQSQPQRSLSKTNYWPWILCLFFAGAWIITLLLWLVPRPLASNKRAKQQALKNLEKACALNDPSCARDALLKWASVNWPDAPLMNLAELSLLIKDNQLNKQLQILAQALYGENGNKPWQGEALLKVIYSIKPECHKKKKSQDLPPINP